MDFRDLSIKLAEAVDSGSNFYVFSPQENWDFTDQDASYDLIIHYSGGSFLPIQITPKNIFQIIPMLKISIFSKGLKLICWNWKNFVSYLKHFTNQSFQIDASIIDLRIIELYAGLDKDKPKNLLEALNRVKAQVVSGNWADSQNIYKKIHLPLITTVIPALENVGILDMKIRKKAYAHYEILGQNNGRLNCLNVFSSSFNPHHIGPTEREILKAGADEIFMYFDFRSFEVVVLQYLSKDEYLGKILQSEDVYKAIYESITGNPCVADERDKGKKIFLPVIFGQSADALANRLKISTDSAEKIINRIHELFPVAIKWVESFQKQVQDKGFAKDIFGKIRYFKKGDDYLARNFCVQSAASTICLDKLVKLHSALEDKAKIAYSVHDGYCLFTNKANWQKVFKCGYDTLTADGELYPGLNLKISCKAGRSLNSLKSIKIKGQA